MSTVAETITQTEVKAPDYKGIATQVVNIACELKAGGCDQETIRVALQAFGNATSSAGMAVDSLTSRRY